jgi:hypothetical protein
MFVGNPPILCASPIKIILRVDVEIESEKEQKRRLTVGKVCE